MNQKLLFVLVIIVYCCCLLPLFSQNIGINTTGTTPDASAGLDIDFTNKGLLIPRLTTAQRNAIASPATALQIYNLDCNEFQYYNGSNWISMINSGSLNAPSSSSATSITQTSFNANWAAVSGATTYYLDVVTDFAFTSYVTGFNNLNVGNVGTYSVTGLTCNTPYYYRVKAGNGCGYTDNSNTIAVTTSCCNNILATGGTVTSVGGKTIHTFYTSGTFTVTCSAVGATVEVLVVAGGGGGEYEHAGGGGGGGLIYNPSYAITPGSISVTVGAGGSGAPTNGSATNGENSVFGSLIAIGGGKGGRAALSGAAGGSGGGGSGKYGGAAGGTGTAGQGNNGGAGADYAGGGGGGAGTIGGNAVGNAGGNGGAGLSYSISGASVTYAGGGGGAGYLGVPGGSGGAGGGGAGGIYGGTAGINGTPNTGGGGGGGNGDGTNNGSGGSGIVIISYIP